MRSLTPRRHSAPAAVARRGRVRQAAAGDLAHASGQGEHAEAHGRQGKGVPVRAGPAAEGEQPWCPDAASPVRRGCACMSGSLPRRVFHGRWRSQDAGKGRPPAEHVHAPGFRPRHSRRSPAVRPSPAPVTTAAVAPRLPGSASRTADSGRSGATGSSAASVEAPLATRPACSATRPCRPSSRRVRRRRHALSPRPASSSGGGARARTHARVQRRSLRMR